VRVLRIPSQYEALAELEPFLDSVTPPLDAKLRAQLVLALHELCMNIVQHAYRGETGWIEVSARVADAELWIVVQDRATRTYLAGQPAPPDPADLPERGWGMFIVHQIMDDVDYTRYEDRNEWRLRKQLWPVN
jgi:serine/threonine-protein kinase RsbW